MARRTGTHSNDSDNRDRGKLRRRLAFENAYRLKKKSLISEIERSLGFGLRYTGSRLSNT